MGETPEQLKSNIDRTRAELSADVDALSDKVSPSRIAQRRVGAVRSGVIGVRNKVMGGVSSTSDSAAAAPGAVAAKAQGNPLAAGLIAFGAGLLLASLLPSSEAEQQVATSVKDTVADPVKDFAKDQAQQAQEVMQPAAQDAIADLKDTATSGAQATVEHAKNAAGDVGDQARDAADTVKG